MAKSPRARQKTPSVSARNSSGGLPTLAKIALPRLVNIQPRQRLSGLLESLRERPLIWLSAPAGAGKTTAVLSWLQSRSGTVIWYQCDEGDGDTASFFHFIAQAHALQLSPGTSSLPRLAPELYGALPTFTRNFFRAFFEQLPTPSVVVLDNWQDIPTAAPLHDLLPVAISEVPKHVTCVIISRGDPAANLARLEMSGHLAQVRWRDVRLTEQESAAIVAQLQPAGATPVDAAALAAMYELTQGWTVALVAMLRRGSAPASFHPDVDEKALQRLFDYLSAEVFERLTPSVQTFLMETACLEYMTVPVVRQLTGEDDARAILDSLVQTNTFTSQRPASLSYHYHPLFREFLNRRLSAQRGNADQAVLLVRAAKIFGGQGDLETAVELLLRARQWDEATRLTLQHATPLAQEGRFKTLADWIEALPGAQSVLQPWLSYWRALACMALDFPRAAAAFDLAYQRFLGIDDCTGQMFAIASLVQTYYISFDDFHPLLPWIDILVKLLDRAPRFASPSAELTVLTGLYTAMLYAQPDHPRFVPCRERIIALLRDDIDTPTRASAVAALVNAIWITGDLVLWRQLRPEIEPVLSVQALPPALRLQYLWNNAGIQYLGGDVERAHALLDKAVLMAEENALPAVVARLRLSKVQVADYYGRSDEMLKTLDLIEPELELAPRLMLSHFAYIRGLGHLAQGNLDVAERTMRLSYDLSDRAGCALTRNWVLSALGEIHCIAGRLDEANDCAKRVRHFLDRVHMPATEFEAGLLSAEIARRRGRHDEARAQLEHCLEVGRVQGLANGFHNTSVILRHIIPYALERGVEVDYCRWIIRQHAIEPPVHDVPGWPWRVQLRCLGAFEIVIDGHLLQLSGKAQRQPLKLLKALVLDRQGCEIHTLVDRYWPDLEGDAGRNAFDLAVHRLRKLLQVKDSILMAQGRLLLNPHLVWVDSFTLEMLAKSEDVSLTPAEQVERLLLLYRGPLLTDEPEPSVVAVRERVSSIFLRLVSQLSDLLQASHDYEGLNSFCQRVLERDPLAEPVYRRWMQCLIAQGRHAEARQVYRRCADTFRGLLQSSPSPSTRELYFRLLQE